MNADATTWIKPLPADLDDREVFGPDRGFPAATPGYCGTADCSCEADPDDLVEYLSLGLDDSLDGEDWL